MLEFSLNTCPVHKRQSYAVGPNKPTNTQEATSVIFVHKQQVKLNGFQANKWLRINQHLVFLNPRPANAAG